MLKKIQEKLSQLFDSSIPEDFLTRMAMSVFLTVVLLVAALLSALLLRNSSLALVFVILAAVMAFDCGYYYYIGTKKKYREVHGIVIDGDKGFSVDKVSGFLHRQKMITFRDTYTSDIYVVMIHKSNLFQKGTEFKALVPLSYTPTRSGAKEIGRLLSYKILGKVEEA